MNNRPYQFPIQVGSLTTNVEEQFFMLTRGDKVVGGELTSSRCVHRDCPEGRKGATLGQSRRRGKDTDRRKTNYAGIVKVTQERSWRPEDCKWRAVVLSAKPEISGEVMGEGTQGAYRCKSRRYVRSNIFLATGEALTGSDKDKGGYNVADPRKFSLKPASESEMAIVALLPRVSKALGSEGPLVFSSFTGGKSV